MSNKNSSEQSDAKDINKNINKNCFDNNQLKNATFLNDSRAHKMFAKPLIITGC